MKIGMIQASSQSDKNSILENSVNMAVRGKEHEVINFGVFGEEKRTYSYVQIALCISLLIESKAIDFVVTGCSSGQGMMLACNSLPGILCGYIENPSDAYLFGRINDGNVVSYPLGLNFEDADRKKEDTKLIKHINSLSKKSLIDVLPELDKAFVRAALSYDCVYSYIMEHGKDINLKRMMESMRDVQ